MIEHKCHYPFDGPWACDSGARYEVILHVECQAPGKRHAVSMRGDPRPIECCATHCDAAKRFMLSPVNRERLTVGLMEANGYPEPNWLTARVEFKPIAMPVERVSTIAPCDRDGCSRLAKYRVMIAVPHMGERRVMEAPTNLLVCEVHRATTLYEALQKAGMMLPDLDKALIRFEPLEITAPAGG